MQGPTPHHSQHLPSAPGPKAKDMSQVMAWEPLQSQSNSTSFFTIACVNLLQDSTNHPALGGDVDANRTTQCSGNHSSIMETDEGTYMSD